MLFRLPLLFIKIIWWVSLVTTPTLFGLSVALFGTKRIIKMSYFFCPCTCGIVNLYCVVITFICLNKHFFYPDFLAVFCYTCYQHLTYTLSLEFGLNSKIININQR